MGIARCWNVITETMPREQLERLQLNAFRKRVEWAIDNSPFYQKVYRQAGIEPDDIQTMDDVRRVPLVSKEELRVAQQAEPYLYGEMLGVPVTELTAYHQTAGTTGKPLYVTDTYASWQSMVEAFCYNIYAMGLRNTDRVFVAFPYNVFIAFWVGHYAAEKIGCEVIPGGTMSTRARISKMQEVRATALMCTPTYGLRMIEVAQEMGIDPAKDLQIRKIICAGEPMPEATRLKLEQLWGANVYDHIGTAEVGPWGYMCDQKKGLHMLESMFLVELLDVETMSRLIQPGEVGVIVITTLFPRSFPTIRYNLKDLAQLSARECPCGRTFRLLDSIRGRTDNLTKIKGVLFTPLSIEEVIRDNFSQIAEFETIVTKVGTQDNLLVKIELDPSVSPQDFLDIRRRLVEALKFRTNLTFSVEAVPSQTLPRYEFKSARFKDLRKER
mgnify:CR=1 FL=1